MLHATCATIRAMERDKDGSLSYIFPLFCGLEMDRPLNAWFWLGIQTKILSKHM